MMILNMSIEKLIVWSYLYFISWQTASTESPQCDNRCLCVDSEKYIICSNGLQSLPINFDQLYVKLTITNGNLNSLVLYQHNLTGFHNLNFLKIIYCKLRDVHPQAFKYMTNLKYLDLSHNNLKVIQPYTFKGLDLDALHLMENIGLHLSVNSFKDMRAQSINLRSNNFNSLKFEIFVGTNVKKLYLYNNRITVIDKRFSEFLSNESSIIDLTGNPLDCSCDMKWILPLLKEKCNNPNSYKEMNTINFTCGSPSKLKGKELRYLSAIEMQCPPAKITAIIVSLGIPQSELTCIATGNNFKAPGLSWNYIEPDNARELRRTPLMKSSNTTENLQTSLSVKVTITNQSQAFTCKTWLEDTQSETIVVNIKAPPKSNPKTTTINTNYSHKTDSGTKDNYRPIPEPHFIFKKQFTILEMIGAVVGTFTITLILLVMLAQILRWWKRGQKQVPNYKSVNIIKPYWTIGHDSNNTYSHPVSHTEYELPRTYETDTPSMCQSPTISRGEFLDYKTQNKIYST